MGSRRRRRLAARDRPIIRLPSRSRGFPDRSPGLVQSSDSYRLYSSGSGSRVRNWGIARVETQDLELIALPVRLSCSKSGWFRALLTATFNEAHSGSERSPKVSMIYSR